MLKYSEVKQFLIQSESAIVGKWACVVTIDNPIHREAGLGLFSYHVTKADAEHNALILDAIVLPAEAGERISNEQILGNMKV